MSREQKSKEEKKAADALMVLNDLHIQMTVIAGGCHVHQNKGETPWEYDLWHVTLSNTDTQAEMQLDYKTGIGHREFIKPNHFIGKLVEAYNGKTYCMDELDQKSYNTYRRITLHMAEHEVKGTPVPPNILDVLYTIYIDDVQGLSFGEWCDDLGYDEDSRKAMGIYLAWQKQTDDFRRAFPKVKLSDYEPVRER